MVSAFTSKIRNVVAHQLSLHSPDPSYGGWVRGAVPGDQDSAGIGTGHPASPQPHALSSTAWGRPYLVGPAAEVTLCCSCLGEFGVGIGNESPSLGFLWLST